MRIGHLSEGCQKAKNPPKRVSLEEVKLTDKPGSVVGQSFI